MQAYECHHIGVAGTTRVFCVQRDTEWYETRVGVSLMGSCDHGYDDNPFNDSFFDNFARGVGTSEESALFDLRRDINNLANSLWDQPYMESKLEERFPILSFFEYAHLPVHLAQASRPFCELAHEFAARETKHPAELAAGLRKLLEAKDCLVRSVLQ